MKTHPIAKINLGLYVTEKRPDGYHNLETVFYPIPIHDELEVEEANEDSFTLVGFHLEGDPMNNLVMRVLRNLRQDFSIPPVSVRLSKGIPSGAGMGGGSSDAAYMMRMLNEMFSLGLTDDEMEQRIAPLGADCAFFIRQRPVLATGIGNVFAPIKANLSGYALVLIKPDDFVSTKEAYSLVSPKQPAEPLTTTMQRPIEEWREHMHNDFELSVFAAHPTIEAVKQQLYDIGATYALMSGSGSTVFALFKPADIYKEEIEANFKEHFVYIATLGEIN